MKILPLLLAVFVAVATASQSAAQVIYNSASTAAEGYARGMADVIRSRGMNNVLNSEAANNWEAARSAQFDNRKKWVETYFETRQMNREYRKAEQLPLLSSEQLFRIAREAAPQPLRDSQLDPVTGQVEWPIVLQEDAYAAQRQELDRLMAVRSSKGSVSPQEYRQIQQATSQMLAILKNNLRQYKPDDYIQAKNFVESLSYQVQRTTS